MKVLLQAIITEMAGSDFNTNIGGRLFLSEAPPNSAYPYCVYDIISSVPDEYFVLSPALEDFGISFQIWTEETSAVDVNDLFEDLKTVYDNCELTVTGYTFVHMWRTFSNLNRQPHTNLWQYTSDYDVMVAK